ncbi:MAG: homoserine kinase, partial [Gemmatimonadota bacterium]
VQGAGCSVQRAAYVDGLGRSETEQNGSHLSISDRPRPSEPRLATLVKLPLLYLRTMGISPLTVRVPASTSNIGAGFDCLGLALNFWLEARLVQGDGGATYSGTLEPITPDEDFLLLALGGAVPPGMQLEVNSSIPLSRGLGSSAAARVAGLVLSLLSSHEPVDREAVFTSARMLEGHPDNAGPAVYGGLVLAADRPTQLELHESLGVALTIPDQLSSTQAARAILPPRIQREDAISQASRAAALVLGLTGGDGDLVHHGMDDRIAVPHRKQLVMGFDQARLAGLEAGAHGVTISGAGSTILAITPKPLVSEISHAMTDAILRVGGRATAAAPDVVTGGFEVL